MFQTFKASLRKQNTRNNSKCIKGEWRVERVESAQTFWPKNDVIKVIKIKRRSSLTWPQSVNRTEHTKESSRTKRKRHKKKKNNKGI